MNRDTSPAPGNFRLLIGVGLLLLPVIVYCVLLFRYTGPHPPILGPVASLPLEKFRDDLPRSSLLQAISRHLHYLESLPEEYTVQLDEWSVDKQGLLESVESLRDGLERFEDQVRFHRFLSETFTLFQAGGRNGHPEGEVLVTGYFEPLFEARLRPDADFRYPLYRRPPDLIDFRDRNLPFKYGRFDSQNSPVPYWSRSELENGNLLAGNELAWLKDPFDAFLLHVQGSGRLLLENGETRPVRFAGTNGQPYNSIGKYLVDTGAMTLEEVSIPAIRQWIDNHPGQRRELLQHNPRFIFFTWGSSASPIGSIGEELTPGRSIALDHTTLPGGLVCYLRSRKPLIDRDGRITGWEKFGRFVLPQDSGAAIRGSGRVDLFWGAGHYAQHAAEVMREPGVLYFLVKTSVLQKQP